MKQMKDFDERIGKFIMILLSFPFTKLLKIYWNLMMR